MKVFIIWREDCSAYGTMGGDHCYFDILKVFLSRKVAEDRYKLYLKQGERANKENDNDSGDSEEWGVKYHLEEVNVSMKGVS